MKRCIRIWFMGAGCLLILISHNAQALWPFGSLKSIAWSGTKKVAKSVIPDNKIDSCLLGGSTLTLVAGIWMKSWLLDGCGAAGFGVYGYRRFTGMEVRIRADIKELRTEYQRTSEMLEQAIKAGNQGLQTSLESKMKELESTISTKIEVLGQKNQELANKLKQEFQGQLQEAIAKWQEQIGSLEKKVDALQGTASGVSTQVSNLSDRLQSTGDSLRQAIDDGNTSLIQQYKSDLDVLKKQLQEYMNTENGNTRERIQSLQKTVDEYQGQINEKLGAIQRGFEDSLRGITNQLNAKTTAIDSLSAQMTENTTSIQNLTAGFEKFANQVLDEQQKAEKERQEAEKRYAQLLAEQKKQGTELTAISENVQTLVATVKTLYRQGEQAGKDVRFSRNMLGAGFLQANGVTPPFLPQQFIQKKQGASGTDPRLSITDANTAQ